MIQLSGVIEKGDLEKLQAMAATSFQDSGQTNWVLVLDSPGGNMVEGIRIGDWLHGELQASDPAFLGTYVLAGTSCMSACALAFSIGSALGGDAEPQKSRFVELGGTLGFHMGFFAGDKGRELAEIAQIMDVTYDVVQAYARLIEDQTSPPDLLIEALKHRTPDSFFTVEASDRARDLGFVPVTAGVLSEPLAMAGVTTDLVGQMCRKILKTSQAPWGYVQDDYAYVQMIDPLPALSPGQTFAIPFSVGETCLVGVNPAGNLLLQVVSTTAQCQEAGATPPCFTYGEVPTLATNAMLADTVLCHMGRPAPYLGTKGEYAAQPSGYGTLRANVNLRATPGLGGAVVTKLSAQDPVQMRDCRLTPDDQALWLLVETQGQTGWVSARYIRLQDWEIFGDQTP